MLNTRSLGATINALNEAHLFGDAISKPVARQISEFIAGRQGLPGSYFGLFAPIEGELEAPFRLFTGEPIATSASARHILGEESLRLLKVLDGKSAPVQLAIGRAQENLEGRFAEAKRRGYGIGTYCCGKCTVAYWRALTTGWIADAEDRIRAGMVDLRNCRHDGKWRRYPFYYTVHCLFELPPDLAEAEKEYIRPTCEGALERLKPYAMHYKQKSAILTNLVESA
jgi:hypothetical protein